MKNMDELHEKCEVYREEYNKLSWKIKIEKENEKFFANHNNDVVQSSYFGSNLD